MSQTYNGTDENVQSTNVDEHECSYTCDCPLHSSIGTDTVLESSNRNDSKLPWDLDKYHATNDDSEPDDGHDTVVLENEFGRYQKCLRCGTEAVGNMMNQFECQT